MQTWRDRVYQGGLVALTLTGWMSHNPAVAQVIPDNTLGGDRSQVTRETIRGIDSDRIRGGATRGTNLFHSFERFDVEAGRGAYFDPSTEIRHIFSRVTGSDRSDIFGRLGVLSDANLFFMNPNGIVFGPNASLDVNGSFVATTANAIQFGETGFFSATNPEAPSSLLAIDPSAFFFNQLNPAAIENQSRASAGSDPTNSFNFFGLRVPNGHSLLLLGGDVAIDNGGLVSLGGRLDLGGLSAPGSVGLSIVGDNLQLRFPENMARANVSLTNGAGLIVSADGGGDVGIHANNLTISGGSSIEAGILYNAGSDNPQAGNITLDATGTLTITDLGSYIYNYVGSGAAGSSGQVTIDARQLNVQEGAQVGVLTIGQGNSGRVIVRASESINLSAEVTGSFTGIFAQVTASGVGNSGDILIETPRLIIGEGGQISAATIGRGDAGNLAIRSPESIDISGFTTFPSGLFVTVFSDAIGDAGNLTIETGNLTIKNAGRLSVSTFGQGDVGTINITAQERITLAGGENNSFILNEVESTAEGNTGGMNISTGSLFITDGSQIRANVAGRGNSGPIQIVARDQVSLDGRIGNDRFPSLIRANVIEGASGNSGGIDINTRLLSITNRAQITSTTEGLGSPGDINISAFDRVFLSNSIIISEVTEGTGIGNGSNITINTGTLELSNASALLADTENQGNAGNITIVARDAVILSGRGPSALNLNDEVPSQITTTVDFSGNSQGEGGSIDITAGNVLVTDGGFIRSSTFGRGNAGDISVTVNEIQLANGSEINSGVRSGGMGDGGSITIEADTIALTEGSQISAFVGKQQQDEQGNIIPGGQGRGGDLRINASEAIALSGVNENGFASGFFTLTERGASGRAGDIYITTGDLQLTDGAIVVASTYNPSPGGNITLNAENLSARSGGQIVTSTRSSGNAGNITVNVADTIAIAGFDPNFADRQQRVEQYIPTTGGQFEQVSDIINNEGANSGIFANTTSGSSGAGGTIAVNANTLTLRENGQISAATSGDGDAGDIELQNARLIELSGNSFISAEVTQSANGRGGNITLDTESLDLTDRARITANTQGQGRAGNITVTTNAMNLADRSRLETATATDRRAGDINLTVADLNVLNGARISARSTHTGRAGNIQINATGQINAIDGTIETTATGSMQGGGNIGINTTESMILQGDSDITTNSLGNGGNITLRATSIVALDDSDILARSQDARGGNIDLQTPAFFGQGYQPNRDSQGNLDGNDRVDVNAEGELASGTITTPDTSLIQNSLADLPNTAIDTDNLIANSCVVRHQTQIGTFIITGSEGLPQRPGDSAPSAYPTNPVRSVPDDASRERSWQLGDPIVEPQGVYSLADGRMVLSRECE